MDSYRRTRSPERSSRGDRYAPRGPPPSGDSYVPTGARVAHPRSRSPPVYRRRSRSPPPRGDSWRSRPRSPPPTRRYEAPYGARGDSYRGSAYNGQYDDRSAPRGRSPLPAKRSRDVSPRGARSPPPAKRERLASPQRDYGRPRSPHRWPAERSYRPRSRSPVRRETRPDPYEASSWRRRSPSPPRVASRRNSIESSRRSSPRGHARRAADAFEDDGRGPAPTAYRPSRPTSPRPRSPARRPRSPYREEAVPYDQPMVDHPAREAERDYSNGGYKDYHGEVHGDYRDNAPGPSGSGARGYGSAASPPTGPTSAPPGPPTPGSYGRPNSASQGPPSGPRESYGGGYPGRGGPRGGFAGRRGGPATWGPGGRGGSSRGGFYDRGYQGAGSPSGPAGPGGRPGMFRPNNSSSKTYPMTQRFNVANQLADLPQVKDDGESLPPLYDGTKADKLEEEAARLRKLIDEKEASKRSALRDWEKVEREVDSAAFRTEMADEHLRHLNGESEASAAF